MHPLLTLLATRPQVLVDHVQGYAALFQQEFAQARVSLRRQVVLNTLAIGGLGVAALLAGVSVMLWAVTPLSQIHSPWVLWAVPLVPLAAAVAGGVMARQQARGDAFANLHRQMAADLAMLRSVNLP